MAKKRKNKRKKSYGKRRYMSARTPMKSRVGRRK